ncbi:Phosphoribosylformylglycinamidine synthase, partial [human gut metagenome]
IATGARPKVAVLREQGVNSHVEMAAAFHRAGFDAIDVHMSDLLTGRTGLEDFHALVACGGFSYGDVLGPVALGSSLYFQCAATPYSAIRCISWVRIWISTGLPPGPTTVVCR